MFTDLLSTIGCGDRIGQHGIVLIIGDTIRAGGIIIAAGHTIGTGVTALLTIITTIGARSVRATRSVTVIMTYTTALAIVIMQLLIRNVRSPAAMWE